MWIRRALVVAALSAGGMLVAVPAASANDCGGGGFCAYDNSDFQDRILFSTAAPGVKVEVADDLTNSGDNESENVWEGKNRRRFFPDQKVFSWGPGDEASELGDASNKIDHFNTR